MKQNLYGWILNFKIFPGIPRTPKLEFEKRSYAIPKLEENQQTLQHLQQERLLYFGVFRNYMSSYCIRSYKDRFYTSISFQRYQEHPNRSLYDKGMTLQSWSKNRGLQQRRDVENQRRDVAKTKHPYVATLLHDVATFRVGFRWLVSPF